MRLHADLSGHEPLFIADAPLTLYVNDAHAPVAIVTDPAFWQSIERRAADTAERQRLADLLDNAATTLRSLARSAFSSAADARQTASDALLSFRRQTRHPSLALPRTARLGGSAPS
jgi:hypothetical protein